MQLIPQHSLRSTLYSALKISMGLGILTLSMTEPSSALPGQTVDEVAAWIQTHPTLQPARGEILRVRKSDTPAHRFTFEAQTHSPGPATAADGNLIRLEQLSFFDRTTGVSSARLQEALQVIYGPEIYQDYQQSTLVYPYPNSDRPTSSESEDTPLQQLIQGEVRQGSRYAYWLEIAPTDEGIAYNGQISIFLIEDIEGLVSALQRR